MGISSQRVGAPKAKQTKIARHLLTSHKIECLHMRRAWEASFVLKN